MRRAPRMRVTSLDRPSSENATIPARGRGFSLLELVLVIVVIATLSGIALPRMTASNDRARAEQAADRVERIIDEAREWARAHSSVAEVEVRIHENEVRRKYDGTTQAAVKISGNPYRANFISVSFGGDNKFTIDGWGRASSGGTVTIRSGNADSTITIPAPETSGRPASGIDIKRSDALDDMVVRLKISD